MPRPPDTEPTPAQNELLRAYRRHVDTTGEPPTVRWLAAELKKSPNAVQGQLTILKRRGDIRIAVYIRPIPPKKRRPA